MSAPPAAVSSCKRAGAQESLIGTKTTIADAARASPAIKASSAMPQVKSGPSRPGISASGGIRLHSEADAAG
jgi:hypothetical protein